MILGSQHFGRRRACWNFRMGIRTNDKRVNYSHKPTQTKQQVGQCMVGALLVHGRAMGIFEFTRLIRLTTTQTWEKPPPSLYSIFCAWPRGVHPNVILSRESQVENPQNFKFEILVSLKAHNFLCSPPIEARSKAKLQPSLKCFQLYVAHHLHASKSGQFLTFSC